MGTRSLGANLELDVAISNANASGVHAFLQIDIGGLSLLEALRNDDVDALRSLHEDEAEAHRLRADLLSFLFPKQAPPASHTFAKQVYWYVDENLEQGFVYHLLAPLYPSSLVREVYKAIEAAYNKESAAARKARCDKKYHTGIIHDHRNLVVQQIVASNPQNVSNIMSRQGGKSYLLSSAPPHWRSSELRIPFRCKSVFDRIYSGREDVRKDVSALLAFLRGDPPKRWETRRDREDYVSSLIGELIQMADEYHRILPRGWSRNVKIELSEAECLWLDPYRAKIPEDFEFRENWMSMEWVDLVVSRFARWLNAQLENDLPVGDVEFLQWKRELLQMDLKGSWVKQLYKELERTFHDTVEEVQL